MFGLTRGSPYLFGVGRLGNGRRSFRTGTKREGRVRAGHETPKKSEKVGLCRILEFGAWNGESAELIVSARRQNGPAGRGCYPQTPDNSAQVVDFPHIRTKKKHA